MAKETTSLSVPKDHTNPTYDGDEDGVIDAADLAGLKSEISGSFATESGGFSYSTASTNETDVSFGNTYEPNAVAVTVDIDAGSDTYAIEGGLVDYNTNGNGKVTGATVTYMCDSSSFTNQLRWFVMGVTV